MRVESEKQRLRTQDHRDERYYEVPEVERKILCPHFPNFQYVEGPVEDSEISTITFSYLSYPECIFATFSQKSLDKTNSKVSTWSTIMTAHYSQCSSF